MNKGIIFDLDMTLVDTSVVFYLRKQRKWSEVYSKIPQTKLFPGIKELILIVQEKFKIGIVTSSPRKYAEMVVSYHTLGIPVLIGYHDTTFHKPNSEPILKAVNLLGLEPGLVYSIGDETKDILSSNDAGTISIGVTWGLDNIEKLLVCNPKYLATSVADLKNILLENNNAD